MIPKREFALTAILSLNFGLVFLDRNALNYLMPFVGKDLNLGSGQIGLLAGATALSWALSGLIFGHLSDRLGKRRLILVSATIGFSLLSVASGFAAGFLTLLGCRLLMGLAEGPVLPVSQSVIASEASPERRGILMGVMNNFGSNLLGVLIAPPLLIVIAQAINWRAGFWLAGVPGLMTAVAIYFIVRDRASPARAREPAQGVEDTDWRTILQSRNVMLCVGIACFMLAWTLLGWAFLPIYFTKVSGFSPDTMAILMSILGGSAVLSSIVVPGLSDRFGRKRVLVFFTFLGVIPALAISSLNTDASALGAWLFVGWMASGSLPIFMATIPSESIPEIQLATAMALVMGVGEVVGGALAPIAAGFLADQYGMPIILVLQAACAVVATVLGLFIIETAPRVVRRAQLEV